MEIQVLILFPLKEIKLIILSPKPTRRRGRNGFCLVQPPLMYLFDSEVLL